VDALQPQVLSTVFFISQWIAKYQLIRCRILDPILYELLDPSIHRIPSTAKVRGKELQSFVYERPFDQRYTHHLLEMLISIIRFGGQGFSKTAKSTAIRRSHHAGLVQRVESSKLTSQHHFLIRSDFSLIC
jgi:hypothetical protein